MGTFTQWNKSRKITQLAWVCGNQPALVREVLAAYRDGRKVADMWSLFADDEEPKDIWDELASPPYNPRLQIVHQAEYLGASLSQLPDLVQLVPAGAHVVFVSGEEDFARVPGDDGKRVLVPHLAALQASKFGQLIRCCAPAKAEDQVALVATWWPGADAAHARIVLNLCGGDLTAAWEACDKAVRAQLAPADRNARFVCAADPGTRFADALVAGNKAVAMAAARVAGPGDVGAGIGLLASRLTALAAIHAARRLNTGPLYQVPGVDRFVLHLLTPYAASYDNARVSRCRELLATAEHFCRAGAAAGVAEAIVALWLGRTH